MKIIKERKDLEDAVIEIFTKGQLSYETALCVLQNVESEIRSLSIIKERPSGH